ncbi:MAG: guanylate kinase [Alphaproteobacteria bacterium]
MGENTKRRGLMLVLSSPAGAGKTTLSRALLDEDPETVLSISTTTRPKRGAEENGVDYLFVDDAAFRAMVDADEFLEHASVFGHSYGTPKSFVEGALAEGKDVLFDIDWQGTQQLSQKAGKDLVRIFILPPTMDELHDRLLKRARDPKEVIEKRMEKARSEISHWAEYDYVLINDDLKKCLADIKAILQVERKRRPRQVGLGNFVRGLMGDED